MKILLPLLLLSQIVLAQIPAYYSNIDFSQSVSSVESQLQSLISSTHNPMSYTDTYSWVKLIDEDPNNTNNVILIYNGASSPKTNTIGGGNTSFPEDWNREHVYPQSMINSTAKADLHHLRACDEGINNNRGSSSFVFGSGSYGSVSGGWYPGDDWRGDVARMVFYVYLRYNEPISDIAGLSLLLQWNVDDPVSAFEERRNNIIQGAQGNRNPFIDQPYLATFLWGGNPAEDTWGWPNNISESNWTDNISVYPNPGVDEVNITVNDIKFIKLEVYNILGELVTEQRLISGNNSVNLQKQPPGVYYLKLNNGSQTHSVKWINL